MAIPVFSMIFFFRSSTVIFSSCTSMTMVFPFNREMYIYILIIYLITLVMNGSTIGTTQNLRSSSVPTSKVRILSQQSHQVTPTLPSNSRSDQQGVPTPGKQNYYPNLDTKSTFLPQKDANILQNKPTLHQPKIQSNILGPQQIQINIAKPQQLPSLDEIQGNHQSKELSNPMLVQQMGLSNQYLYEMILKQENLIQNLLVENQEKSEKISKLESLDLEKSLRIEKLECKSLEMANIIQALQPQISELQLQFKQIKASSVLTTSAPHKQDYSPQTPPLQFRKAQSHQLAVGQSQIGNGNLAYAYNLSKEENKGKVNSTPKQDYHYYSNYSPAQKDLVGESNCKEMKPDCSQCKIKIDSEFYCSPCNHYFHKQCLLSLISSQKTNQVEIKCYCSNKILFWIQAQFYNTEPQFKKCLEQVFENQLNKLRNSLGNAKISCRNKSCKFFWIVSQDTNCMRNNQTYCPDCMTEPNSQDCKKQIELRQSFSNNSIIKQKSSQATQSQIQANFQRIYSNFYDGQPQNQLKRP